MRSRKLSTIGLVIALSLTSLAFKCGGGCADTDPRCNYAKAADNIAGGLNALIKAKRSLAQEGRISADEERRLTTLLNTANEAAIVFNNKVRTTTTIDASNATELGNLLANVTSAVNELNAGSGIPGISNNESRQKLARILATVTAAIAILNQLRSQGAPTPTP
ncbi:MAG: hypothetical protein ABW250_08645 [Pyrinomonadaceae bacterium]